MNEGKRQSAALAAARGIWLDNKAKVVLRGQDWFVVGRTLDGPDARWCALLLHDVDDAGAVWWGGVGFGTTKDRAIQGAAHGLD